MGTAEFDTRRTEAKGFILKSPADECTFWFVGDYLKPVATSSTTRIAAIALPGCK